MAYYMFDIRSGKRHYKHAVEGLDEAEARLVIWSRFGGVGIDVDDVKLLKVYSDQSHAENRITCQP